MKTSRASNALDGEGARRFGGRWNSPGTAVIYTAQSESLAALEMLVHLQASQLLMAYSSIPVEFDDELVEAVDPGMLTPHWRDYPAPTVLQQFGDQWAAGQRSVVLQAPSVVIPGELNFIINPGHRDFRRLTLGSPKPFRFDPRLK